MCSDSALDNCKGDSLPNARVRRRGHCVVIEYRDSEMRTLCGVACDGKCVGKRNTLRIATKQARPSAYREQQGRRLAKHHARRIGCADVVDPVDVAVKFNESGLTGVSIARIAESLKASTNTKSVEELIEAEKAYVAAVSESAVSAIAADTTGVISEAIKTNPVDELDAIVSRIAGK